MEQAIISAPEISFESSLLNERNALRQLAMQLTRNIEDANDLVQDTMLKALRYRGRFKNGSNLKAWLYTILKNSFINDYRRKMRRNTFIDTSDNLYFLDLPAQSSEHHAELKFIRKDLEKAIDELPNDLRVTFLLNTEGFKYHEIASELGIPLGTVKTRIFVARRILRQKLQVYGEDIPTLKKVNE